MRSIAVLLALGLAGCGPKAKPATPAGETATGGAGDPAPAGAAPATPRPTPSDAELERLFAASLDLYDAMGAAIAAHSTDCAAMATALEQVLADHQALLDEMNSYNGNTEVDDRGEAYMTTHQDRIEATNQKAGAGMNACHDDPAVGAVMKRFGP